MSTLEFREVDREGSQGEAGGLFGCESWESEESWESFGRAPDELADTKETADGLRAILVVVVIGYPWPFVAVGFTKTTAQSVLQRTCILAGQCPICSSPAATMSGSHVERALNLPGPLMA